MLDYCGMCLFILSLNFIPYNFYIQCLDAELLINNDCKITFSVDCFPLKCYVCILYTLNAPPATMELCPRTPLSSSSTSNDGVGGLTSSNSNPVRP